MWKADHRVRRFIRPVLMRDPQVQIEEKRREQECAGQEPEEPRIQENKPRNEAQTDQEQGKDRDSQRGQKDAAGTQAQLAGNGRGYGG